MREVVESNFTLLKIEEIGGLNLLISSRIYLYLEWTADWTIQWSLLDSCHFRNRHGQTRPTLTIPDNPSQVELFG